MVVKGTTERNVHFLFRSKSFSNANTDDDDQPSSSHQLPTKSSSYGGSMVRSDGGTGGGSQKPDFEREAELLSLLQVSESTGTQPKLIKLIAAALEMNVEQNELQERLTSSTVGSQHMMPTGKLTVFHGLRPPPISLQAYVERLAKYTKCSPACFIISLHYMDQLAQRDPSMLPTRLNIHRLLLAGILVAAKLMDDHYFNNAFYGRVGGVTVQEVNRLELELLKLLEYRLWVPWEDMRPVLKSLLQAKLVLGQGEGDRSSSGRKRRSVSGTSAKRSARRSSMDSSVGASTSVSASAYDAQEDDGGDGDGGGDY